jgi:2,4-dienoyl-CoA reductase-like NADH-dependent reductase (Old Yellow Enzyme family)
MKLGNLTLRNSFFMGTFETGYGDSKGNIRSRHHAFWDKRSKHVAAVIFEFFFIRKRNSGEAYFISDSNYNLFEIKILNR